jgi:hypothetical protein
MQPKCITDDRVRATLLKKDPQATNKRDSFWREIEAFANRHIRKPLEFGGQGSAGVRNKEHFWLEPRSVMEPREVEAEALTASGI